MDKGLATIIAATAQRMASEMGHLLPLLKTQDDENCGELKIAIATAVAEIGQVKDLVFKDFPELEREMRERVESYGRAF